MHLVFFLFVSTSMTCLIGLGAIKKCITIDSAHYPERLKYMFVVNVPSIFTVFWKILKPWVDPVTLSKVSFLSLAYVAFLSLHFIYNTFVATCD
jgi:hypothetical protein